MTRVFLILCLVLAGRAIDAQDAPLRIDTHQLSARVRVFSGFANGNVLALDTPDGVILVDAQTSKRVGSLDSALRLFTRKPVRWIVNTHYHEDHTQGNAHYSVTGAQVLAHRNAGVQAAKDTFVAEMDWRRTPLASAAMPTRVFDDTATIELGGVRLLVHYPGPAHTDGDAIVWIPAENVLHIGDQFEVGAPPFVDWWAGGSVDGMIRAVELGLAMSNDSTRIVPGHGPVSSRADLARYREMLVAVQSRVREGLARGTADEKLAAEAIAGFEDMIGGPRRAQQFSKQVIYGLRRR